MDRIITSYWHAVGMLFAAFMVLFALDEIGVPAIHDKVWWPLAAAFVMMLLAAILDSILWRWFSETGTKLKALCIGVSFKPFHWGLGDESHLRRPGGGLYAFGPLRFAWRFAPCRPQVIELRAPRLIGRGETLYLKDGALL